ISVHFDRPRVPDERERRLTDICARKAAVFIERAQAKTQAEAVAQRFETVLEASAVPFTVLAPVRDESGHIVDLRLDYVNNAAAKTLRHSRDELVGRCVTDMVLTAW